MFYVYAKTYQRCFLSLTNYENLKVRSVYLIYSKTIPVFQDQYEFSQ